MKIHAHSFVYIREVTPKRDMRILQKISDKNLTLVENFTIPEGFFMKLLPIARDLWSNYNYRKGTVINMFVRIQLKVIYTLETATWPIVRENIRKFILRIEILSH